MSTGPQPLDQLLGSLFLATVKPHQQADQQQGDRRGDGQIGRAQARQRLLQRLGRKRQHDLADVDIRIRDGQRKKRKRLRARRGEIREPGPVQRPGRDLVDQRQQCAGQLLRAGPCQHLVLMIQYRGVDQTVGFFRRTQRHIQHQDVFLQYERPAFLRQAARGSRPMLVERIAGLDRCGSIKQKAGGMRGDTDHNAHQKSLPAAPHKFGSADAAGRLHEGRAGVFFQLHQRQRRHIRNRHGGTSSSLRVRFTWKADG